MVGDADRLTSTLAALADPNRRAILARLVLGEADVAELTERLEISQPAVSKHLRVLEGAGLVSTRVEKQRRPRILIPDALIEVDHWLRTYRQTWDARFNGLDQFLSTSKSDQES